VGSGPDEGALKRLAGPTVRFTGSLSDKEVAAQYARCKALIFPGEEDFGMVPVECMASGRPVVAYAAGGALETVSDGRTGIFFQDQTVDSLAAALTVAGQVTFSAQELMDHARLFDSSRFHNQIRRFTEIALEDHHREYPVLSHRFVTEEPIGSRLVAPAGQIYQLDQRSIGV
jgi:glycosyltransferase involved in cell wall biosynthesis